MGLHEIKTLEGVKESRQPVLPMSLSVSGLGFRGCLWLEGLQLVKEGLAQGHVRIGRLWRRV